MTLVDAEFYKKYHTTESVDQFMKYVADLEQLVRKNGWNLDKKFTQETCAFKAGFFRAFGIWWEKREKFALFFHVSEQDIKAFGRDPDYWYENKVAIYFVAPGKTQLKDFLPLFEKSYRNIASS